ncbi:MAG: hypothetical protein HDS31_04565 [Bacteroides sp.]|nr:hypothetical protein [Bacteroides sp.]
MKHTSLYPMLAACALFVCACGGDKTSAEATVAPGANASDKEKVQYIAQTCGPDSLARFICYAALGKSNDGKIDSLAMAQLYALEIYQADDEKIARFSRVFDETVESLPLADSYRLTEMTGTLDDTQMPIDLGLHYGAKVKRDKIDPARVKTDTASLARIVDPHFFELFQKAFDTAIKN